MSHFNVNNNKQTSEESKAEMNFNVYYVWCGHVIGEQTYIVGHWKTHIVDVLRFLTTPTLLAISLARQKTLNRLS